MTWLVATGLILLALWPAFVAAVYSYDAQLNLVVALAIGLLTWLAECMVIVGALS